MVGFVASLAVAATALIASVSAQTSADPIVTKGSKFFYKSNGTQFYIRGVDYQQDPDTSSASTATINDPLTDSSGCQRDLPYLLKLRTNTVRVYAINPNSSHDACMELFASNGIYVIADLSYPGASIDRSQPSWNIDLYDRYTSVIDVMSKYTNTLGFFAGNEVSNSVNTTAASAYVKAAVRDMKSYISSKNYRTIPVGYATSDDQYIRDNVRAFMGCGTTADSVDMFGYNIYEWCSSTDTYDSSGYKDRTAEFANYSVPPFFAEYGCVDAPRLFDDTPVLFSDPMDQVWNGGLVYEYFSDAASYGLATVSGNSVKTNSAFEAYATQIAKVDPSSINAASYTPTNTALQQCPGIVAVTGTTAGWLAAATLPPTPNNDLCNCAVSNTTCQAKSSATSSDEVIGELLGQICGTSSQACAGISGNATNGVYGAYSMCSGAQQLSLALNAYFILQGSTSQACDWNGNATIASPTLSSTCASQVSQAGGALGSGTAAAGSGGSSSAAGPLQLPPFDFGLMIVGLYTLVAVVSGAGLFIL